MRSKKNAISDIASSYTKERKKSLVREKKNARITSEELLTGAKMTEIYITKDLNERLIEEVAKRVEGVRALYPTDQVSFFPLDRERREARDFNPPILEKYKGKGDLMAHLLYFKPRMSIERVSKALTCKLFATTLTGKAFTWFIQLPEGSLGSFTTFRRKFLE